MKILLLVRHASSGTDDMSLSDRYRPLEPRGERELAWLAARCAGQLARPELIVSSPAVRALSTAQALAEAFGCSAGQLRSDERLYGGGARGLLAVLRGLDDALARVVIVGHNPEVSEVARHFAPQIGHLPSGTLAALAFDVARWSALAPQQLVSASLHAPAVARPSSAAPA
ncbi:MAG: histidine phosphatase family protein [Proteobacteria bacterium]|nr:histidine phosphatase family protein [Pseudomonadota bacterium]